MKFLRNYIFFPIVLFVFLCCRKETDGSFDPEKPLTFSEDTVKFDTVFTTIGSTTRRVKIFNKSKDDIIISNIELSGGESSAYQLNINGLTISRLTNFKIRGRDSANLFVRVNIDPTSEETPFIISDSISFSTNEKVQKIQLQAFGQNARFVRALSISTNTTWDRNLPYVVYDSVKVQKETILTLSKGARVYFHKGAKMIIAGTLKIEGTASDSVTLASDRKEKIYSEVPGQWEGINFLKSSKSNLINHALIKNGLIGLQLDQGATDIEPRLTLVNSVVKNMEAAGILGYNTSIAGFNNLIANCGRHLVYCTNGGDYNFKQNTFANYFNYSIRTTPSLFFSDYLSSTATAATKLTLINNIIWGNQSEEFTVEKNGQGFVQTITSNLIRTKDKNVSSSANQLNSDPLFRNVSKYNFRLLNTSPAANRGENLASDTYFQVWLKEDQTTRQRLFPSELGCYEIF